jgi:hypothetical protein
MIIFCTNSDDTKDLGTYLNSKVCLINSLCFNFGIKHQNDVILVNLLNIICILHESYADVVILASAYPKPISAYAYANIGFC